MRPIVVLSLVLLAASPAASQDAETPKQKENHPTVAAALKGGVYGIGLRYRFEGVSDDAFAKDSGASTLRTRAWYESARFHRLFGFLDFENVADLGFSDQHDSTANGLTDRPVIADPKGTEVQQVYLGYEGIPGTRILAGRQEIVLDDARFVGDVAWRQNVQSFDGARLTQRSIPRTTIDYAWVRNVNTVFGTNRDSNHHLVQAEVGLGRAGSALLYYYLLDFGPFAATSSTETWGARWAGKPAARGIEFPFRLEWATQEDAADNPGPVDADYLRAVLGLRKSGWRLDLGYELLGGSSEEGQFNTPLATLHKFNGWADKFLTTPANGLLDLWLSAGYGRGAWSADLIGHSFEADTGGADYGRELDGQVVYRASWGQDFALKFALYDADVFAADTEKLWVTTTYAF